jgi:acyl-CoA thioester hydrolase
MRWADLDLLGHVNNVVYVDYLQEARVDMLRVHGRRQHTPETPSDIAEGVVVVRHEVTYLEPLLFDFKPVLIECWVTEIRAASFTLAYEIFRDRSDEPGMREVYVRATTVLTPYVFADERPRRITAEERARLEQFFEPTERAPRTSFSVARSKVGHYPVHVRFSDVDAYGHVNNVKYFEFLQEGRMLLMARLWRDVPADTPRANIVVAQTDVDYKQPILFRPEPYDCWTAITRVGTRSMTMESEICDGDRVLAQARVVIVFFDFETGRSAEPPAVYRDPLVAAFSD